MSKENKWAAWQNYGKKTVALPEPKKKEVAPKTPSLPEPIQEEPVVKFEKEEITPDQPTTKLDVVPLVVKKQKPNVQ